MPAWFHILRRQGGLLYPGSTTDLDIEKGQVCT